MNVFSIQLTLGHLIVGLIMVAVYDLGWDLIAPDPMSDKWFQRKNVPLRAMFFGALITLVVLAGMNLMLALWLAVGLILLVGGWFWWKHNHPVTH